MKKIFKQNMNDFEQHALCQIINPYTSKVIIISNQTGTLTNSRSDFKKEIYSRKLKQVLACGHP